MRVTGKRGRQVSLTPTAPKAFGIPCVRLWQGSLLWRPECVAPGDFTWHSDISGGGRESHDAGQGQPDIVACREPVALGFAKSVTRRFRQLAPPRVSKENGFRVARPFWVASLISGGGMFFVEINYVFATGAIGLWEPSTMINDPSPLHWFVAMLATFLLGACPIAVPFLNDEK